jgi:DNA-binding NtrC family response regulator
MREISKQEYLEILESLLEMTARKEAEIAELKAQLDVFKPKDIDLKIIEDTISLQGRILLIFQSRTLRDILKTMLENSGHFKVETIDRYEDASSTFAIKKPEICVLEHGSYGQFNKCIDIIREIRAMSRDVGLISVLPENDVDVIRDVVTAGVDDFLVKPIDTRRMNNVIFDIMMKRSKKKVV